MNAYRDMSGPEVVDSYPSGYQAYVVYAAWDSGFVQRERLKVVYHDSFTDAQVTIRPEVEDRCKQ